MNKSEFITELAKATGLTKKDVTTCVSSYHDIVKETLKKGEKVQFIGFGTYEVTERKEREGRNPRTGEKTIVKACKAPKFKPGKEFKDYIN